MTDRFITAPVNPRVEKLSEVFVNLASQRLGSKALLTNDDFFAPKERLIDPNTPIFVPDKYDEHGKWMDGWESRRRRTPGHDWCIIKLGYPGRIKCIDVDTSFFTGNYAPQASIDACHSSLEIPDEEDWQPLAPLTDLQGDTHNFIEINNANLWSHLRLNIVPDGGVARLRVFGELETDWSEKDIGRLVDLASLINGAKSIAWSDAHYGRPSNILAPTPGKDMGDGWETARRRGPGNDWCIIKLAATGIIEKTLVDTSYFKGNYPDSCIIQGSRVEGKVAPDKIGHLSESWPEILPSQKLDADCEQTFEDEILSHDPVNYVKLSIFPDGGISRLRLFGKISEFE